jgi:hypothetical protein
MTKTSTPKGPAAIATLVVGLALVLSTAALFGCSAAPPPQPPADPVPPPFPSFRDSGPTTPIGGCLYNENPLEKGTVTIRAIRHLAPGWTVVDVDGMFKKSLDLSTEHYESCIQRRGYVVGSRVPATMQNGGPCPPQSTVGECRQGLPYPGR